MRTPANNLRLRLTRGWRIKSITPRLQNFHNYGDHSITTRIQRSIRSYQQRTDYGLIFSHAIIRRYLNRLFQLNLFFYEGAWCEKKFKIKNRKKFRRYRPGKRFKREYPRKNNINPNFSPLKNYEYPVLMEENELTKLFKTRITRKKWVEEENAKRNWVWRYRRRARRRRIWRMFLMRQELWFFRFSFLLHGYRKNPNYRLIFHFFEGGQMTANSVANYIVGSLTNQFRIRSTIYRLIKGLQIHQFTSGLMTQTSGRFTRRQMSTYEEIKKGRMELNKFYSKTRYAFAKVTLKYSLCGIKVWIPPLHNVKALYVDRIERYERRPYKYRNERRLYVEKIRQWKQNQLQEYIQRGAKTMKSVIKVNKKIYPLTHYTNVLISKFREDKKENEGDEDIEEAYEKFKKRVHYRMRKWLSRQFWCMADRRKSKPTLRRFRIRSRNLKYRRRFPKSKHALMRKRNRLLRVYLNFLRWKKQMRHLFIFKRRRKYYYYKGKRYRKRKKKRSRIKRKKRIKIYKKINSAMIKKRIKINKNKIKSRKIFTIGHKNEKTNNYHSAVLKYRKFIGFTDTVKHFVRIYAKSKSIHGRILLFKKQIRIKNSGWHELKKYSRYNYRYKRRERRFVVWRRKFKKIRMAIKERRKLKAKKNIPGVITFKITKHESKLL